jgi:hypothetical protein
MLTRLMHPNLLAKFDALDEQELSDSTMRGAEGKRRRALWRRRYQLIHERQGAAILGRVAVAAAMMVGCGALGEVFDSEAINFVGIGAMAIVQPMIWLRFYRRLRQGRTAAEFRAQQGLLSLSPSEAVACEAVCVLSEVTVLPEFESRQLAAELNRLLDLANQADAQRAGLATARSGDRTALVEELQSLNARLDATTDAQTRATLQQSIALCAERLANRDEVDALAGRADAQAEVILQNLKRLHETLLRLRATPHAFSQVDLDAALKASAGLTALTHDLEKAAHESQAPRLAVVRQP